MAKIGILTYFNYYNYGSMLQGYATQVALEKYLDSTDVCELINYRFLSKTDSPLLSVFWLRVCRLFHYIKNIKEVVKKCKSTSLLNRKHQYFDEFRNKYTKITESFYRNKEQLEKNPPIMDCYVTGSDQTWSPIVSGGYTLTPMFLDFAPKGKPKVAYAPSLGTTNLSQADAEILKQKLVGYDIVSCRESDGVNILKGLTDKKVYKVLDPTLLLAAEEWRTIAATPNLQKKGYILCYFIGERDYYREFAKQLSIQVGLPLYYIPVSWKDCNNNNLLLPDIGPREFVGLIDNAKLVLTDSFHGTAFSVNLNTDFYSFVKHSGGKSSKDNSRLFDFLSSLHLESRLIENFYGGTIHYDKIDYDSINDILKLQRSESYEIIKKIVEITRSNV